MKVITYSRQFPATHPRKGEPTGFVEKIWDGLIELGEISLSKCCELSRETGIGDVTIHQLKKTLPQPKWHTIRAGHRWKVGDWFSPRVWSGKPYASKQVEFAPPIQIKKIWDFDIRRDYIFINRKCFGRFHPFNVFLWELAKNDGLTQIEMIQWFSIHPKTENLSFSGQILCWNESVNYLPHSPLTVED
jgi:hypothetical protein